MFWRKILIDNKKEDCSEFLNLAIRNHFLVLRQITRSTPFIMAARHPQVLQPHHQNARKEKNGSFKKSRII